MGKLLKRLPTKESIKTLWGLKMAMPRGPQHPHGFKGREPSPWKRKKKPKGERGVFKTLTAVIRKPKSWEKGTHRNIWVVNQPFEMKALGKKDPHDPGPSNPSTKENREGNRRSF